MGTWYFEKKPHPGFQGARHGDARRYLEVAVVVGDRIRRLRLDRKMRLFDLAHQIPKPGGDSYSVSHLSRLERGSAHAPLYVYLQIATALDVDPWQLLAPDEVRHEPRSDELVLLRFLRRAGIAPDDALARLAGAAEAATPAARPAR